MKKNTLPRVLTALLTLACASGAIAQAQCPPAAFPLARLEQLKSDHWVLADSTEQQALALALCACLPHPNPALRDGLGYEGLAAMLQGKLLTPVTQHQLYQVLLAAMQSPVDPEGFGQPFAVLTLAEVARANRLQRFLNADEHAQLLNAATRFVRGVTDYRGFSDAEGWRHGVAHGADLLVELALDPSTSADQLSQIVQAARAQIVPGQSHSYIFGESDRLARAVVHAASRGLLNADYWHSFFADIAAPKPLKSWWDAFNSQAGLAQLHNTRAFLRATWAITQTSDNPALTALLAPPIQEAMKQLL